MRKMHRLRAIHEKETFMKRYFVVSDVHSFFTCLKNALDKNGFSIHNQDHVLILCGDAFDRGTETRELAEFLLMLNDMGRLVYIKGNHESLFQRLLQQLSSGYDPIDIAASYHAVNGTWRTILDLAEMTEQEAIRFPMELVSRVMNSRVYKDLLPSCVNYFETKEHISLSTVGYRRCPKVEDQVTTLSTILIGAMQMK